MKTLQDFKHTNSVFINDPSSSEGYFLRESIRIASKNNFQNNIHKTSNNEKIIESESIKNVPSQTVEKRKLAILKARARKNIENESMSYL